MLLDVTDVLNDNATLLHSLESGCSPFHHLYLACYVSGRSDFHIRLQLLLRLMLRMGVKTEWALALFLFLGAMCFRLPKGSNGAINEMKYATRTSQMGTTDKYSDRNGPATLYV